MKWFYAQIVFNLIFVNLYGQPLVSTLPNHATFRFSQLPTYYQYGVDFQTVYLQSKKNNNADGDIIGIGTYSSNNSVPYTSNLLNGTTASSTNYIYDDYYFQSALDKYYTLLSFTTMGAPYTLGSGNLFSYNTINNFQVFPQLSNWNGVKKIGQFFNYNLVSTVSKTSVLNHMDINPEIMVNIPRTTINLLSAEQLNCSDDIIKMSVPILNIDNANLIYEWKYKISSSNFLSDTNYTQYKIFKTIQGIDSIRFYVNDIPEIKHLLLSRTSAINVNITVLIKTMFDSSYSIKPYLISVLPASPLIQSITTSASCPNSQTGQINIKGITGGSGSYKYFIRNGLNNNESCNPNTADGCLNVVDNGNIDNINKQISNLASGEYTLWLANNGAEYGACATKQNITINKFDKLTWGNIVANNIQCNGGSNGYILASVLGGVAPFTYSVNSEISNSTGRFEGLSSGNFTLNVTDGCEQLIVPQSISLTEPPVLNITANVSNSSCIDPASGIVTVGVNETLGNFYYKLYNADNQLIQEMNNISSNEVSFIGLSAGSYIVKVFRASELDCLPATKSFSIFATKALSIQLNTQKNIQCHGVASGYLSFTASGGINNGYRYFLKNNSTNSVLESNNGDFYNLAPASYSAWVMNADVNCDDISCYVSDIVLTTPSALNIISNSFPVSCNGKTDGKIETIISGGVNGYTYTWEEYDETDDLWFTRFDQNGQNCTNISSGKYRLMVTDSNLCELYSNVVNVLEPVELILKINSVKDIVCKGSKGVVDMLANGGNGSYVYQFKNTDSLEWNSSTLPMLNSSGDYNFRVQDRKGCIAEYEEVIQITEPSDKLTIKVELSDYNGFNVSCYGINNANISINADGGNGMNYEGYKYSFNNGAFSENNIFISASGIFPVMIKDARGCIDSTNISISQPPGLIKSTMISLQHNNCASDNKGSVVLKSNNQIGKVCYKLNNSDYSFNNKYDSLKSGDYVVVSQDQNSCTDTIHFSIIDLFAPLTYTASVDPVKCFGDSTGTINIEVDGGYGKYIYLWDDSLQGTDKLNHLPASVHHLLISDSLGCKVETEEFVITQPREPLTFNKVEWKDGKCFGDSGMLLTSAFGGSGSRKFSYVETNSNNKIATYSNTISLHAGSYKMEVIDSNFCNLVYPHKIIITSPSKKLQFKADLSNYNGLNISCYGANNGFINATPIGGNSDQYNGYWFAINDGNWLEYNQAIGYMKFDSLKAGLFKISVKDARSCVFDDTFNLVQADNLINIELKNRQNNLCADSSNGFFEIMSTNSIHPVLYSLDSGISYQQSSTFERLYSKKYHIKILDANGCTQTKLDSIVDLFDPIQLSTTVRPILCYGSKSGSIIASVDGGSKPYKVIWFDSSIYTAGDTAISLGAGKYHLMVKDQFGCNSKIQYVKLENPKELIINSIEVPEIVCFGDSVSLKVNTTGGVGKYYYWYKSMYIDTWLPLLLDSAVNKNTKLGTGSYQIKVTDDNHCSYTYPFFIYIQAPEESLVLNLYAKKYNLYNVSCFGNNNGQIEAIATGGNGGKYQGYNFSLNGDKFDTVGNYDNLFSGTYTVSVRDGRGCIVKKMINLIQPDATILLDTISVVHNNCFDGMQGSVSLTAKYGMPPYSYNVNDDGFQINPIFNHLPSGKNLFKVRDANGCGQILPVTINNLYTKINLETITTDNHCKNQQQGSVLVNASGGSGNYLYHWLNSYGSSSSKMINELRAGKYSIQVSDILGCYSDTTLVFIKEPDSLKIVQVIAADPICYNDSVTASISSIGGDNQFHYLYKERDAPKWNNFYPDMGSQTPTKLLAGNYQLKVLDANNCESSIYDSLIVVNPPQPLSLHYQLNEYNGYNVACYNGNNGAIKLNGFGGNGNAYNDYDYSLNGSPFSKKNFFDNLSSGNYHIKIKDGRGCVIAKDIALSQPLNNIEPDTLLLKHNSCIKGNEGEIYLTAKNGAAPYSFAINDDKHYQSIGSFNNLSSSPYNLFIKDNNGCSQIVKLTIKDVNQPILSNALINNVSCYGGNNGKITLSPSGGVPPYTFNWLSSSNNSSNQLKELIPSTYSVLITDSKKCLLSDSFVISQPVSALTATIYTKPVCTNNPVGAISFNPKGGTFPYVYSIDKGGNWNEASRFDQVKLGKHLISVRDANGCIWDSSTTVINNTIFPSVNFLVSTDQLAKDTLLIKEICVPKADSIRWNFDPSAIVAKDDAHAPILQFNYSGAYYIGLKAWYNGCDFIENKIINIQPATPSFNIGKGIDQLIVSPNPNNGLFNLRIQLFKPQRISASIYEMSGKLLWYKKWQNTDQVQEQVNVSNLLSNGMLLLKVITDEDARDVQLIIAK